MAAGLESIFGIVGEDFVIVAADSTLARSIVVMHGDYDKIMVVDDNKLLAAAGDTGDVAQFTSYVKANIHLYRMRHDASLSTHAAAHYTRGELAYALRRGPYAADLLLGGVDEEGPSLFYIDYLGTLHKLDYGCHGHASNFLSSVLDKMWKPGLSVDRAMEIVKACIDTLQHRFIISNPKFVVKMVNKDGVTVLSS